MYFLKYININRCQPILWLSIHIVVADLRICRFFTTFTITDEIKGKALWHSITIPAVGANRLPQNI